MNHFKESQNHLESSHQLMLMNRQKKFEIHEQEQDEFKTPEGTRRDGPPFPNNLNTKSSIIHTSNPREEERRGEERENTEREGGAREVR